jgi:excinuclease ABC subunit C
MSISNIEQRLQTVPESSGIYIMKDIQGNVLYVGKANVLKNRVKSYFQNSSGHQPKTRRMVARIDDFEFVVTDNESEALILENTFIKKYKPPYNVRLKDDKTYPYLKIDLQEDFPRVYLTRKISKDGARYFGPFATVGALRRSMDLLKKLFPYRSCTKTITGRDAKPCLEFHINRCVAPCTGYADKDEYDNVIQQVILFLEGKTEVVENNLKTELNKASDSLNFERAAVLRDQLASIRKVSEEQETKVASLVETDSDVIALEMGDSESWVEIFFIRTGRLVGRDNFFMQGTKDSNKQFVVTQFIKQFYETATFVPPTILVETEPLEIKLIEKWLTDKRGKKVNITAPKRGNKKQILEVASKNAKQGLTQHKVRWLTDVDAVHQATEDLQEYLGLSEFPSRIECYDVSHIQGTNTVGSMVVFEDGVARPKKYRRFKIKTVPGVDDYESMKEMVGRRFSRLTPAINNDNSIPDASSEQWAEKPQLVLIDGGKGQLSAVLEVMLHMGLQDIPIASLAKENEWIYVPDSKEPIILPRNSESLFLVQRLRDEAHRFAITYHRNLRSKSALKSPIDMVSGIGPKRKKMLIRSFGSVQGIRGAAIDDIAAVPGMTRTLAIRVKEIL